MVSAPTIGQRFNISLRPQEFASSLNDNDAGKHQAYLIGWSGRIDPDGNIHQLQSCKGTLNATLAKSYPRKFAASLTRVYWDAWAETVAYAEADLGGAKPALAVQGWNVEVVK